MTHQHSAAPPDVIRGRSILLTTAGLLVLATAIGMILLRPTGSTSTASVPDRGERISAEVTALRALPCPDDQASAPATRCAELTLRLDAGPERGQSLQILDDREVTDGAEIGQRLILGRAKGDLPLELRYELVDVERGKALLVLVALFAVAVIALGRWRGALALVGLGTSMIVLVGWLVPALLDGRPPLLTATVGASAVMIVALLLSHGPSLRTVVAMLGTASSLLLIIGLSTVFVELASLTGLTSEEAQYVRVFFGEVDLRGLLLAGIVIGALGILDDVTVTQVSTVWELRAASPDMPGPQLFAAALRVGRDHIASTVNTLLLAYAGASLPLLVIFTTSGESLVDTLTNGVVGQEIVRTLAGSIGLVAAVPITTALAAYLCPPSPGTTPVPAKARHRRRRHEPHAAPPRSAEQSWS